MRYWLMKSEPEAFSWQDLQKKGTAMWDGVRSYAARNHMRAMEVGDLGFFTTAIPARKSSAFCG